MWIKILITFLTFAIAALELFDILNKYSNVTKKRILIPLFTLLIILTVWDTRNEDFAATKQNYKVDSLAKIETKRANKIFSDLGITLNKLEKTNTSIVLIDSILKDVRDSVVVQVEVLKTSLVKSQELVRLEQNRFNQDEANIVVYTSDVLITKNTKDSTLLDLSYQLINNGIRNATNIKSKAKILFYNIELDSFHIANPDANYDFNFSQKLAYNTKGGLPLFLKITQEEFNNKFDQIVLIIKCEYTDEISKKPLTYETVLISRNLKSNNFTFGLLSDRRAIKKINSFLTKEDLGYYTIDLEKYLD